MPKSRQRSAPGRAARANDATPAARLTETHVKRPLLRVGCGVDAHPLRPGRRLVLGGVEIPHPRGLAGHSDADVLSHAVCDALLGALALDDMGTRFPDSDESLRGPARHGLEEVGLGERADTPAANLSHGEQRQLEIAMALATAPRTLRGRPSLWFLEEVMREARTRGFEIVNVDTVILAEAPRLQPHIAAMRKMLAAALGVSVDSVTVKAKRLEGMGAVGRQEGIMAQAIALLAGPT